MAKIHATNVCCLACHSSAQAPSAELCVGSMAKKHATWICGYGVSYQCTKLQRSIVFFGRMAKKHCTRSCGFVLHFHSQVPSLALCLFAKLQRKQQSGFGICLPWKSASTKHSNVFLQHCEDHAIPNDDWCATSMHRPPTQHCVLAT